MEGEEKPKKIMQERVTEKTNRANRICYRSSGREKNLCKLKKPHPPPPRPSKENISSQAHVRELYCCHAVKAVNSPKISSQSNCLMSVLLHLRLICTNISKRK